MRFIKRQLTVMQEAAPAEQATEQSGDDDDDFFVKKRSNCSGLVQLDEYLLNRSTETAAVMAWPLIKELFIRTNTPLPASAACKRLFSAAGHIFTPLRARIGDKNVENQLVLKLNKNFVQ
ncbi:hypothetical protein NP493_246g02106 [Ridgeia piscesae]|uniref:HAT C-terminal dimerisation domain-containing protein n=1 Tax=Ridgeia piscesae TaxID=27915 RepID=A0AAD9NZ06_RIDPI|nr:hypothetical protein NP493_246g02106 [Ridgeia piscesae]